MSDLTREQRLELYRFMRLNRVVEERLVNLYRQGKVPGSFYDGYGQEAVSAGAAFAMGPEDRLCVLHRDLAAHLIRGVTPAQRRNRRLKWNSDRCAEAAIAARRGCARKLASMKRIARAMRVKSRLSRNAGSVCMGLIIVAGAPRATRFLRRRHSGARVGSSQASVTLPRGSDAGI